jgi:hypothetical protein
LRNNNSNTKIKLMGGTKILETHRERERERERKKKR